MPLTGEYEPSTAVWARKQAERYEASGGAELRSVTFIDSRVDELNVAGSTLSAVDLSGARLRTLVGTESLRGAIIGQSQLIDLAPLLAAQLGLEVRHDPATDRDG